MRYCLSYLVVLILPTVAISASFNTRFIADYRQELMGQLQLTAEKTMSDLERQLSQMDLIAMHFSSDGEYSAGNLKENRLIYRNIRGHLIHYRYISNYVAEIIYINCQYPEAYYTSMGTYNGQYFNQYLKDGKVCTAVEYLRGLEGGFWIPGEDVAQAGPAFKQMVEYATPVVNVQDGWLIFCVPMSQLMNMLDLSGSRLEMQAMLNSQGQTLYEAQKDGVSWREALPKLAGGREAPVYAGGGSYIIRTVSDSLGLSCVYSISEHEMLAKVDQLSQQFIWLLIIMLVSGCALSIAFSHLMARPIDALIDMAHRTLGGEESGGISTVKNAIESVHRENLILQSQYMEIERRNVLMRLMSSQYDDRGEMEEDCLSVCLPTQGQLYTVVLIDELRVPTKETEQEISRLFEGGMQVFGFRFRERQCQIFLLCEEAARCHKREVLFERLKGRYPGVMMAMGGQTSDLMQVQKSYQDGVFARRMAQMKGENAPVLSDGTQTHEGQIMYPKQEIEALYNILRQKDVEKLSFIQDSLMFNLRALGGDPVYQQALCYDIISTYNLALAKMGIGGRSDQQPFRSGDRGSLHIDRLLEIIQTLYNEALDTFIAEESPAHEDDIAKIVTYIDEQREEIPNAYELAERFKVSSSNLSHQFKRATGKTLSSYIAEHKVRLAREFLETTDMDVMQIGERLGYTHSSSFIRMFHRVEGVTPMQYREEHAHGGTQRQDRRGSDEDFDQDR